MAVTAAALGPAYAALLARGALDGRSAVALFLLAQRALAGASPLAPYIRVLPAAFDTTIFYAPEELEELKGTPLHAATKAKLRSLRVSFDNQFEIAAAKVFQEAGLPMAVQFEDYLWATSVFWSRAKSIPFPAALLSSMTKEGPAWQSCNASPVTEQTRAASEGGEAAPEAAVSKDLSGLDLEADSSGPIWEEGLVPGIDFCNHSLGVKARWDVDDELGTSSRIPNSMYLVTGPGVTLAPDQEVCISYGNKSNEELLFLYGFVIEDNPHDHVMIHYPASALGDDPACEAKAEFLRVQGLSLRWLLSASHLDCSMPGPEIEEKRLPRLSSSEDDSGTMVTSTHQHPRLGSCTSSKGDHKVTMIDTRVSGDKDRPSLAAFPSDLLAALRVLSLSEQQADNVVNILYEQQSRDAENGPPTGDTVECAVRQVGSQGEAWGLLIQLLQARLDDLEEGTGPEDADVKLLSEDDGSSLSDTRQGPTDGRWRLTPRRRGCVVYRRSQKHMTRLFLQAARQGLSQCQFAAQ
eukprot:SM000258S09109  [mRNA]  locus=s258:161257:165347:- [translate_table: standard]